VVTAPPLRARPGDAALLAHAFVLRYADEYKRPSMTLLPDALKRDRAPPLAGQRAAAGERDQAGGDHGRGHVDRAADLDLAAPEQQDEVLNLRVVRDEAEAGGGAQGDGSRQRQPEQGRRVARREPADAVRPDAPFRD